MNLLIEELCAIELLADKLASAEATSFVAHENEKKSNFTKVNSSKSTKRGADPAKQKFLCNKSKKLGHWERSTLKNSSMQGPEVVNLL